MTKNYLNERFSKNNLNNFNYIIDRKTYTYYSCET